MPGVAEALSIDMAHLRLRPARAGDSEALFPLFDNWNVVRWLSAPPWPYHFGDMESFLRNPPTAWDAKPEICLAIEFEGEAVGMISWRLRKESHLQREDGPNIGYWLGEPFWSRGIMSEAVAGLCRFLFERDQATAIYSGVFEGNEASLRVQEKLGFVRDGVTTLFSNPQRVDLPHINTMLSRERFETLNR